MTPKQVRLAAKAAKALDKAEDAFKELIDAIDDRKGNMDREDMFRREIGERAEYWQRRVDWHSDKKRS